MFKHIKFTPVIIIILLINVFLITLSHHQSQIRKKKDIIEDEILFEIANTDVDIDKLIDNKNIYNSDNYKSEPILESLKEHKNADEIENKIENKNTDKIENIDKSEIKKKKENIPNNRISKVGRIEDIFNEKNGHLNHKLIDNKESFRNREMKFFDKQKDFIGKLKNKQKEKSVPNNGVDDTNEFRSLKPFYENLTKKKLLEEYYDPNKIFWKDIKFGSFPIPSLDNMSNRTEYQNLKNKLYADAIQSINSEQDKQNKRVCYDDERELRFLLKYSRDVENGVRHDELEPEWQWAADISIVYTWVNGSDPIHLEQKAKYNGGIKKADNRDRSVDELRFSLRSLFKYLPWHKGTIFIVTPGQTPEWLDTEFDRIKIINQEDILPKKDMNGNDVNPTFNSFAIEWYLDRIPGLTEQFIQLNDDYFFNQPVHPSYFFYGSGESYDIDEEYIMYFNKEQELKKSFPYFYYKFYKHSDQYKMTSKLTYYKYLNNKHLVSDFSPCIQELLAYLKSKAPYEFINMHHSRCITKALIEINKYYNSNENKASTNTTTTTTTKATSATLNSINEDKKDEKINTESIFEIERIKNNNKDNNVSESKEKEENIEEIEEEELNHSKKKRYEYKPKDKEIFFPNAAQHFRFPNFFLALHFLINDIQYAKNVGRKSFSQTTMSERFVASLAMTNGAIKSLYGRYIRTNQLEHSPYVWYRDLFPMSREKFKNYIDITLTHKFRHPEDVIPPFANQAFIRYTASKKGFEELFDKFYSSKYIHDLDEEATGDYNNKVINRNRTILKYGFHIVEDHLREKTMRFGQIFDDATRNIKLYSDIIKEPYLFFNFNDDYNEPRVSQELHEIMEYLFPDKGVFEK